MTCLALSCSLSARGSQLGWNHPKGSHLDGNVEGFNYWLSHSPSRLKASAMYGSIFSGILQSLTVEKCPTKNVNGTSTERHIQLEPRYSWFSLWISHAIHRHPWAQLLHCFHWLLSVPSLSNPFIFHKLWTKRFLAFQDSHVILR